MGTYRLSDAERFYLRHYANTMTDEEIHAEVERLREEGKLPPITVNLEPNGE